MVLRRYYYTQLTPREKRVYEDLYMGLLLHEENIVTAGMMYPERSLGKIVKAVQYDHPEIYFLDSVHAYTPGRKQMKVHVKYLFDQKHCKQYDRDINRRIRYITGPLDKRLLDACQKEKFIYDYFASHYTYDYRDIPKSDTRRICCQHNILGALWENTAVCEGFAKTFKFVMDRAGLECMVVRGYSDFARAGIAAKDGGHAWNIVWLRGKFYHVDVTWAICCSSPGQICHDYLNLSDIEIRKDHKGFGGVPICKTM